MSKKRGKYTPFAVAPDGRTAYLGIDLAIEWCRKEMEHHSKEKYETMIAVMEKAKAQEAKDDAPTP